MISFWIFIMGSSSVPITGFLTDQNSFAMTILPLLCAPVPAMFVWLGLRNRTEKSVDAQDFKKRRSDE